MEGQLHLTHLKAGHRTRPALCLVNGRFSMFALCSGLLSPGSLGWGRFMTAQEAGSASLTSTPTIHLVRNRPAALGGRGGRAPHWEYRFPTLLQGPLPTSCLRSGATFPVRPPHLSFLFPTLFSSIPFTSTNILYVFLLTFM